MSMEENEKQNLQEEQNAPAQDSPQEEVSGALSEEEKREILSVFAETNENKHRRTGFRMTIRNQLILIGSVLVLAGVLLGVYFLFLKEDEPLPDFYQIGEQTEGVLDALGEKAEITFCNRSKGEVTEEADPDVYRIYTYATLYASYSRYVKLSFDSSDTYNGVRITCGGNTLQYAYEDFYCARAIDGAIYGFTGESIFTNALLELTGGETLTLSVRALDGYDEDGNDVLASGGVVMFPMVARENIAMLILENEAGSYTVYQNDGTFYFSGCELLTYNAEQFASLLVDCRYVVTSGKLEEQLDYSVYGLDKKESLTCNYTLMTTENSDGSFYFHQIWIGKKAASGAYYYAMYFGGKMDAEQNIVESYSSPRIFLIPYANVEGNLTQPVEYFFDAQIVNSVSDTNDVYNIDQILMEYFYYDEDQTDFSALILNLPILSFSDNTSSNNSSGGDLLKDKATYASSGLAYTDWTGEEDSAYLVGLTSSDSEMFTVSVAVTNTASDGVYECRFGLLLDSDNATYPALLPDSISIRYTTDGINYRKFSAHGLDFSSQKEDTVQEYSFRIESAEPILKIELGFTMPKTVGYLVMDEIRVFADGEDAIPNDALTGLWRMVQPKDYILGGKNFAYMDSTNFSEFLYGISTLQGDSVAKVGISQRDENQGNDIIDTEMLAEFGLDRPAMHFSYLLNGYVTDLYVSAYDEENACYYAYSTITGDVYSTGKNVTFCTGLIARISTETAAWLEWDPQEYVDHSLVGMYVYEIEQMTITYAGTEYVFNVTADGKTLTSVCWGDTELDEESFRFLYLSIVQLNMRDTYIPAEGETPTEYLRIRIKTTSDEKEYVFYRVSSSRACYTINGSGSYYCLFSSLRNVTGKLEQFIAGEKVGK